ncbi:ArsA family ATPase [Streptomyces sp. MBT67]|uniref:ArsA family ATPase n=1 Tax=unclassified Streptomyces TaxID=2593676 RepID=UPI00190CC864|nr:MULTISPECIES: ArsA-related P-loop ATPase [unclassified Streptomyces]MBK3535137.1 ArsA family ATPase [Streptomyces sp. MBT67]MBK3549696.1 ArsA family ATPase [Streptomyces sp. MBT61]MBK6027521.1 ArsA family ATPase [Streptomyces sp. MBT59]
MRTVLVTGPGGAGRTTVAAATALAAADRGGRTLLLSAEAIPGFPAATGSTPVTDRLDHVRIDSGEHFRAELTELQNRASGVLDLLGAGRLDGEELTELPGSLQLALLHTLRRAAEGDLSGYDTLVVDLPPLTEALALLALPEQLRRYLRRLLPAERQAARALRPVLAQLAGVPMPAQWLYEAAARKDEELAAVQALIEDEATTLRLVAEPGPAAEDALRTARTGLALHGLRADLLVASRVLPRHSSDPWFAALAAQQEKCLDHWHQDVAPGLPVHEAAHLGRDPEGADDLAALEIPAPDDRTPGRAGDPWWTEEEQDADDGSSTIAWCLPLPGAAKEDLRLVRRGDELLLTVGAFHRIVRIASALRRCTVSGAALADGVLRVRFTPDPALWPRTS